MSRVSGMTSEINRTSQWFKMAERPPKTDLSGGKTSADSFARLIPSLIVEYTVDPKFDLFLSVAFLSAAFLSAAFLSVAFSSVVFGLIVDSEGFDSPSCSVPVTDPAGSGAASPALGGNR